jgi:hypothetical protein
MDDEEEDEEEEDDDDDSCSFRIVRLFGIGEIAFNRATEIKTFKIS